MIVEKENIASIKGIEKARFIFKKEVKRNFKKKDLSQL